VHRHHVPALRARHGRRVDAQTSIMVGKFQLMQDTGTERIHRLAFQPSVAIVTKNQHDFRTILLHEPGRQGPTDRIGRKILRLDINRAASALDSFQIGQFDLPDLRLPRIGRLGAHDTDAARFHVRHEGDRPELLHWSLNGKGKSPSRRVKPSVTSQLTQGSGRLTRHHHLNIVKRRIGLPVRVDPKGILASMRRGIPSGFRQIQPSDKSNRVVDDHKLLVMRGADRMLPIHLIGEPTVAAPARLGRRHPFTLQSVDHGEVPIEHMDSQLSLTP